MQECAFPFGADELVEHRAQWTVAATIDWLRRCARTKPTIGPEDGPAHRSRADRRAS